MSLFGRRVETASPAPLAAVPAADRRRDATAGSPDVDVSFVMVTFGTGPIVVESLSSLVASLSESDVSFEVIVVDNPHPDRSDVAPRSPRSDLLLTTAGVVLVTPDRNLGFGGGCELGALHATAPILGFVNPDTLFSAGWLEPLLLLVSSVHAPGTPVIVAPTLLDPDGSVQEIGQTLFADGHTAPNVVGLTDSAVATVDYASAACWIVRRDDHERLGGFDPAYHPAYFEDVDLALRVRRRGGRTLVHQDVTVTHHRGSGTPDGPSPANHQRETLLANWPAIGWQQPRRADRERPTSR